MSLSRVVTALLIAAVGFGCAGGRGPNPKACAAAGALAGAGAGVPIGTARDTGSDWDAGLAGGAIGAVAGGVAGYLICAALQKEEAPPPPAPAPPPPAPAPAPAREKIVLRGVNFDFDKSDIRPDAAVILDEAASILQRNADVSVSVEGHTDGIGTDAYNQGLSERRAASVRSYLSRKGVDAARLTTRGWGESKPIASNDTRDGRALNRRVELIVTNP